MDNAKEILELTKLVSGLAYGFGLFILAMAGLYWKNHNKVSHVKRTADNADKNSKEALDKAIENEIIGKAIIERLNRDEEHRAEVCKLKHEAVSNEQKKFNSILQDHGTKLDENNKLMQGLQVAITTLTTEIKYIKPSKNE